jgi:hypothetical protein
MFPDPTLRWRPYPSVMDRMKAPPFVLDRGLWRGVLNLMVLECAPGVRAYGVEIKCDIYCAFEEMIHSIAHHGDGSGMYRGDVYIKEAENSNLLEAFRKVHPLNRNARQFLFVGGDFCYETLGSAEPVVHTFASKDEAYAWTPGGAAA